MRTIFAVAAGLGLAAVLYVSSASAQNANFPAQNFHGGNIGWSVVLLTQDDASVVYSLKVPEARGTVAGKLKHKKAPAGQYVLTGVIGAEKAAVQVNIAPVKPGQVCKDSKGGSTGAHGPYTHVILIQPAQSSPVSTGQHKAWPKAWFGCGDFSQD